MPTTRWDLVVYLSWACPALAAAAVVASGCTATTGTTAGAAAAAGPGSGGNLIKNADFESGSSLPWTPSFTPPAAGSASVDGGWYCLKVDNKGAAPWDAQVRHREMVIQKGHKYSISFKIKADQATRVRSKVGMAGPPYTEYWVKTLEIGPEPQTITGDFTMNGADDPTAEWAFHGGGTMALPAGNFTFCIDDVFLTDPEFTPAAATAARQISPLRVNQLGYLPQGAKHATLVSDSATPVEWELVDGNGASVLKGQTVPFGLDRDSGDPLHAIDFGAAKQVGQGFRLRAQGAESPPFQIAQSTYKQLKYDAVWFFYHNRSGIPIELPFAGKPEWVRPAGHLSDAKVPCAPVDKLFPSQKAYACDWTLDVSGGWYDAGDHGKYVVNGGIAVWTLLNLYERAKHLAPASVAEFGDGKLRIPEQKNGVHDLLDEVRWELEWELKMQVPEGKKYAGMAHHKIHDVAWTALGLRPPTDTNEIKMARYLRPPSTAATLNLAANAAQAARIWKSLDPAFAKRCERAAKRAWNAATQNPRMFAPKEDTTGGGPYDDVDVSDEWYWAAAELFITTGHSAFKDALTKSRWHLRVPQEAGGDGGGTMSAMTWQLTAALGTISLAVVPNQLGADAAKTARGRIVEVADGYLAAGKEQGYRIPFRAPPTGGYPWGSNSFIINNALILGLAYDFTQRKEYVEGVADAMNYLFGNNPLGQSYVSWYGSVPLENPHHRWFSYQVNNKFPKAIPGLLSGGPNSGLQDPYVQAANVKASCEGKPQRCFIDNIEAWSVNEVTINWNAPLVWVAAFLDDLGKG